MAVKGNDLAQNDIEPFIQNTFGDTFIKGALTLYSLLPERLIESFEILIDSFINVYAGARKVDIVHIAQDDSKFLWEFMIRFHIERYSYQLY